MDLTQTGKWMTVAGAVLAVAGGIVWIAGKSGLPLGGLPGDINIQREDFSFRFPIVTCILVSIVLTVVFNLITRLVGK